MNIFTPFNDLIMAVTEAGLNKIIYISWNFFSCALCVAFCFFYRKKYGIRALESILMPMITCLVGYGFILLLGWAHTGFRYFGEINIVKAFSFFPILAFIFTWVFKIEFNRIADFIAPSLAILQFFSHFACNITGCCLGYPMEHGIWNPIFKMYLFPVQLLESFVALLVAIICIIVAKKNEFRVTGRIYPLFLILFGSTRFFLEFLRVNIKLFAGISELALWALLMVIVGAVWLIIDKKQAAENQKRSKRKVKKV